MPPESFSSYSLLSEDTTYGIIDTPASEEGHGKVSLASNPRGKVLSTPQMTVSTRHVRAHAHSLRDGDVNLEFKKIGPPDL